MKVRGSHDNHQCLAAGNQKPCWILCSNMAHLSGGIHKFIYTCMREARFYLFKSCNNYRQVVDLFVHNYLENKFNSTFMF